jgi:dTDP-4-dehydrorhamnose 3,5-epimerase-like enzyme
MLSNREFSGQVDAGSYPEQVAVPLDQPFVNENGQIQNILLERFTSVAFIKSVPGAIRANHFHKTDWHYSYVLTGSVWYYWRPVGATGKPKHQKFPAGTMFFTPPNVEHAMFFPEDTDFITMAKNIRDTEHHESDVVRVKLIEAKRDPSAEGGWLVTFPTSQPTPT